MKIYFSGSVQSNHETVSKYQQLIDNLKKFGEVLTEYIGNFSNTSKQPLSKTTFYNQDIHLLGQSDLMVVDTIIPSLNISYELAYAQKMAIPVIVLHNSEEAQAMKKGIPQFHYFQYSNLEQAKAILNQQIPKIMNK